MNDIAIIGGAGTVGRHIVTVLQDRGHTVRVLSRSASQYPVDLRTGDGLEAALAGCETVIQAANSTRDADEVLVNGSRRLAEAAARAGVGHLVGVSIVGIDDLPMSYYRAKLAQEAVMRESDLPVSILRSTQFHELVLGALAMLARRRVSPRAGVPLQPVATAEAATVIADVAGRAPTGMTTTLAGPQIESLSDLARAYNRARPGHRVPIALPMIGAAGRALKRGALTCPDPDHRGTVEFGDWLSRRP